jgi:hypothetical protein
MRAASSALIWVSPPAFASGTLSVTGAGAGGGAIGVVGWAPGPPAIGATVRSGAASKGGSGAGGSDASLSAGTPDGRSMLGGLAARSAWASVTVR